MVEILLLILFVIIGIWGGVFLLKIVDSFRFRDEIKLENMVEEYYYDICLDRVDIQMNLSDKEKIFYEELKDHLNCKNIGLSKEIYLRDIFCLQIDTNKSKKLRKLMFFTQKDYYCVNDVYILYNFIEEKFIQYLARNEDISVTELNLNLLGSDNLEEDEIIDKLLQMNTLEFIQKFSILS